MFKGIKNAVREQFLGKTKIPIVRGARGGLEGLNFHRHGMMRWDAIDRCPSHESLGAALGQPWGSPGAALEQPWGSPVAALEQEQP